MKEENIKRVRLLRVWEILKQETDEDHPLSTTEILNKLATIGIECDRRTLYSDIKILDDFGYEIMCNRSASNEYYVVDRNFDLPEIQILIDAVQAASFITESKTKVLIDKIAQLAGSQKGEILKKNVVEFSTVKGSNESVYYSINEISMAIEKGKKIEFLYFDYSRKKHEGDTRICRKSIKGG